MIRIEEKDGILDIVKKMNSSTKDEILLEFPFGHPVLHNHLFLQILKEKAGSKKLTIVTTDILSRKIGGNLGIRYVINEEHETYVKKQGGRVNLLKHNLTFFEYFWFEIKNYFKKLWKKVGGQELQNIKYSATKNNIKFSGITLLILGLLASSFLFIFIFYFAVNKTYVYITPEIDIRTKAKNFVYQKVDFDTQTMELDNNTIPTKQMSLEISLQETFQSKTIDYSSTGRAKGKARIVNELPLEQTLKDGTRLLTPEGVVYRTKEWVTIPRATKDEGGGLVVGEALVDIEADLFDEKGVFIGEKGNIEEAIMILPGLKNNKDKIYAYLKGASGGTNNYSFLIGEEDIKEAQINMEEKLKKEVVNKIKEKIKEENKTNGTSFAIMDIKDVIKFENIETSIVGNVNIGDKIDKFGINGRVKCVALVYDKKKVLKELEKLAKSNILVGTEKLVYVDEDSVRISHVMEKTEDLSKIKATTQVQTGISYDFENNSNNRVKRIKNMIMGLTRKQAEEYLQNVEEISKVEIKNSPFFIKNVSGIEENIIIKIKGE